MPIAPNPRDQAWNGHPAYRDPGSPAFAQWCDHLARTRCRPNDPNLIGYFLVDAPAWATRRAGSGYPASELPEIADAYYRVATEAIRKHDPHHLILGDRYGTRVGIPEPVLDAAAAHVDVLSLQTFPAVDQTAIDTVADQFDAWHQRTGLPILVADTGNWCPTVMSPARVGSARDQAERGRGYQMIADTFATRPWCLGWHWCSWLENPTPRLRPQRPLGRAVHRSGDDSPAGQPPLDRRGCRATVHMRLFGCSQQAVLRRRRGGLSPSDFACRRRCAAERPVAREEVAVLAP